MQPHQGFQQRIERIDELVSALEGIADPATRAAAKELVAAVMELHGAGLGRIVEVVSRCGEASAGIIESLTRDPLVSSLLILHEHHPVDLETRVRMALERNHGAELVSLESGVARVRLGHGGDAALEAVRAAAPDLNDILVDAAPRAGFVPISALAGGLPEARS
jgi:hypothetical protein